MILEDIVESTKEKNISILKNKLLKEGVIKWLI